MAERKKIIQVPVSEDLLRRLDEASRTREQSRSALIREACVRYIADIQKAKLVEQYERGYERFPEGPEEDAWAEMGAHLLAERLAGDSW